MPRRTLAGDAMVQGVGLHTGARVTARCVAAEPGRGIVFRRVDLPGAPEVPARLSHVRSTERRTALGEVPGTVETVEHLLGMPHVTVERWEAVKDAVDLHRSGLDFADALHWVSSTTCTALMTFDGRRFARRAKRLSRVPPVKLL